MNCSSLPSDRVAIVARVDEDVCGEGGEARGYRPYVQVVDVLHVGACLASAWPERVDVDVVGCCFEEHAARVAKETVRGANHDCGR